MEIKPIRLDSGHLSSCWTVGQRQSIRQRIGACLNLFEFVGRAISRGGSYVSCDRHQIPRTHFYQMTGAKMLSSSQFTIKNLPLKSHAIALLFNHFKHHGNVRAIFIKRMVNCEPSSVISDICLLCGYAYWNSWIHVHTFLTTYITTHHQPHQIPPTINHKPADSHVRASTCV